MASTHSAAPASTETSAGSGWTSLFDLDLRQFRGKGKADLGAFARELHASLPDPPVGANEQRRRLDRARAVDKDPSAHDYTLVALADGLPRLLDAMRGWPSKEVVPVVAALRERWRTMGEEGRYSLRLDTVADWVRAHDDEPDRGEAVAACISVDAPVEVEVTKRLSKTGSQKVVFEAMWAVADDPTEIVLKQLQEGMQGIFERELRPHPLSMRHPNIIETYWLANQARMPEVFLVERRLQPLRNQDRLSGESEAARLFVDLMRALTFLDDQGLVHGDIKPDNVGYSDGRFILLDFGICRPAPDFRRPEATATGSLRTRAPELLLGEDHSGKSDVWAVGATVFNLLLGRFPLWRSSDPTLPTLQEDHGERAQAEERMRKRIEKDYSANLAGVEKIANRALRSIVQDALTKEPLERPTARALLARALDALPSLIGNQDGPLFEAKEELRAMERYLSDNSADLGLMSERERDELQRRLGALRRALSAERHFQRRALRLELVIRCSLLLTPAPDDEAEAALHASETAARYLAREDQQIDEVWTRVQQRIAAAPTPASPETTATAGPDLAETLHKLAASTVGQREEVADAVYELEVLIGSSP